MKVVQVVPSLSQSSGGLFVSISHLARYSMAHDTEVVICGPRDPITREELAAWEPAEICTYPRVGPARLAYAPGLLAGLERIAPDVLHAHGLWTYTTPAAHRWRMRTGKPYVISIHGMLEPWSLAQSRIKKAIARRLYQDAAIETAGCLRATSNMEADNIRAAGFRNPIAVVPNGVMLPDPPAEDVRRRDGRERCALFLSRIHPKKGLENLIAAWREVRPANWKLRIVGPGESGYVRSLQAAISAAGLTGSVEIAGPTWGAERFREYWEADLFVLPSFSENFGLVVAEALVCEVPVITTRGLPWQDLETYRCGWWIDIGVEPLSKALRDATSMPDPERREMGARGRGLIAAHYTWDEAARKMTDVYRWLIERGAQPDCVRMAGA